MITFLPPPHKTQCTDKKVSRNAATLELKESGEVTLMALHINPVFYGNGDELKALKTNKSIKLKNGDVFSLTQTNFKYQVELEGVDLTKSNGNSTTDEQPAEELKNGNGESKNNKEDEDSEMESEEEKAKKPKKKQVFCLRSCLVLRLQNV